MKTLKLPAFLLVMLALTLMSFNSKIEKNKTTYYTYLEFTFNDFKTKTVHVFVSDVIDYDDWLKNQIELRNKFIAKAAEQSQIEIWAPGIKCSAIENSIEEVKIKRQTSLNRIKNWEESNGRSLKTYYVNLYRL